MEKHMNMQQRLEMKKTVIEHKGKTALESGMQNQIARQEEKKERERLAIITEKNAIKATKKPKKEEIQPPEWGKGSIGKRLQQSI